MTASRSSLPMSTVRREIVEEERSLAQRAPSVSSEENDSPPEAEPDRPQFRPQRKRSLVRIALALIVIAAIGFGAFLKLRPKPVTTSPVVRGTAVEAVYATGTVEALDRVTVKAKTSGSMLELKVKEGARVKKGDLLATIDSPSLKFELAKGKADLWAASQQAGTSAPQIAVLEAQAKVVEAELGTAKDDRERLEKLVASGAATQNDLDKAKAKVNALEAQLVANLAQRKSLRIDLNARASGSGAAVDSLAARLSDTEVRAPMDGVVLAKAVEVGEVVMVNQPLFKIGDVERLVLECAIDEADVGRVALGKKTAVSLYAFPQTIYRGEVIEIMPDADRAKKSFLVKVKLFDPPAGLRSGMSAEVNVIIEERPGSLLAPSEAIDATGSAWVVTTEGRVTKRAVKYGVRDMMRVEILGGVSEGEMLVITGGEDLKEGARVKASLKTIDLSTAPSGKAKGGMSL